MTRVSGTTLFAVIVDKKPGHANSQRALRGEPSFGLEPASVENGCAARFHRQRGAKSTARNSGEGHIAIRLDRFLYCNSSTYLYPTEFGSKQGAGGFVWTQVSHV